PGPNRLHGAPARLFPCKRLAGYSPAVRAAALALICAILGAAAALGLGRAFGLVGGSTTTETVVVRAPAPARDAPAAVRAVAPTTAFPAAFPATRVYARRSPGVVTVF